MRIEPFTVGDLVHVYNRGNRKMLIVRDESDRWRFMKILRYFNDEYSSDNIFRDINEVWKSNFHKWGWPPEWPRHNPLVKILYFCLMPNHFHLLLKEIKKGGISKFMAKLGTGFTNYINVKYEEVGRVFQGSYKGKTLHAATHLDYLSAYIQIINPLEFYPGGFEKAVKEFNKAFEFAMNYQFSSLPDFMDRRNLFIIDKDVLGEMFPTPQSYQEFAYDAALSKNMGEILGKLKID